MKKIRNVTVVGAGTMGHSLALIFAQHGYNVWLTDLNDKVLARAKNLIGSNLKTMVKMKLISASAEKAAMGRLHTTSNLEEAAKRADFVMEAIIEDKTAKKTLFRKLDRICPKHAILASNASFLDIFRFMDTKRPDKVVIAHWFHPPHIIPLVEIVRGPKTSNDTVNTVKRMLIEMGRKPIVISKFLPGFIINRLQSALRSEALHLLDNGYSTPEEIDTAVKWSVGIRTPITGVVQRMDFAGLDVTKKVLMTPTFKLAPQVRRSKSLEKQLSRGRRGVKNGKGFYNYGGRTPHQIMSEFDTKLLKMIEFMKQLEK
jgi:3-hydroxybutyryl-CoA dehydrogenase